jgi:hypothetical protein
VALRWTILSSGIPQKQHWQLDQARPATLRGGGSIPHWEDLPALQKHPSRGFDKVPFFVEGKRSVDAAHAHQDEDNVINTCNRKATPATGKRSRKCQLNNNETRKRERAKQR